MLSTKEVDLGMSSQGPITLSEFQEFSFHLSIQKCPKGWESETPKLTFDFSSGWNLKFQQKK